MNINLAKGSYKNFFLLLLFAFLSSFFFASRVLAERGTGGAAGGTSAPINGCGGGPVIVAGTLAEKITVKVAAASGYIFQWKSCSLKIQV